MRNVLTRTQTVDTSLGWLGERLGSRKSGTPVSPPPARLRCGGLQVRPHIGWKVLPLRIRPWGAGKLDLDGGPALQSSSGAGPTLAFSDLTSRIFPTLLGLTLTLIQPACVNMN